jgi:TPR repeat protein
MAKGLGVAALELSKESLDMLEKASEAGLPYSQHLLGLDLLLRQKSIRKGTSWLTRASDQGFVVSTVFLADYYFREAELLRASLGEGEGEGEGEVSSISGGSGNSLGFAAATAAFESEAPAPLGADTGAKSHLKPDVFVPHAGTVPVVISKAKASADAARAKTASATAAAAKEHPLRHKKQTDTQNKGAANGKGSKSRARRSRALLLEKAARLYHIAALDGVAHAQFAYGLCVRFGLGVPADAEESQAWLERAAKQRHPKALYQMGRFMVDRRARQGRLSQRGLRYLRRAYLDKVPEAALLLGRTYERTPRSVPPDPLAAMAYYDIAMSLGNVEAANDLARLQARVLPDVTPEETFAAYQELAPRSSAALVNVAICHSAGYGTPVNLGKAVACAEEAMKRGFPPADNIDALLQLTLARRGAEGDASSWRPSQALLRAVMPRFRRAAAAGDADAQYNLARCILELKDKAPNDVNEATAYLCEAAAHGHVGAQMYVGVSMQQGDVFPRDVPNGERYIRRAREQGVFVTPTPTTSSALPAVAAAATAAAPIAGLPWPPAQVGLHHADLRQKINPDFLSMAETPSGMLSGSPTGAHQGAGASSIGRDALAARLRGVSPDVVKSEAERGDAHALCQLGLWYLQGINVEANTIQGVQCFDQAARKGLASAQSHLAECYLKGVGISADPRLAVAWFELAAEQDEPVALCNLAHLWQQEQHSPQKLVEAARLYERAARQGMPTAQCCLASCYFEAKGVPRSSEKAVYWWQKAQEGDVAEAWFNLGLCYLQGRGLPEDPLRARQYFLEAAVRGNVTGQCNMGVMFERGLGGAKDLRQSYAWWRRAAGKSDPAACRNVGNYMLLGIGTSRRVAEGLIFLKFAAYHRDLEAILTLAEIYERGQHGVHSNLINAFVLYQDPAVRGNVRAQLALARLLESAASSSPQVVLPSSGNLPPIQEAEQWYRHASKSNAHEAHYQLARFLIGLHGCARKDIAQEVASLCLRAGDQGYGPAQFCLSLCYQAGIGVGADAHAAETWRQKAEAARVTIKERWPANSLEGMLSAAYWSQGAAPDVLPAEGSTAANDTPSVFCPPSPMMGKVGPITDEDQDRLLAKRGGVGGEGGDSEQPAAKRPNVIS